MKVLWNNYLDAVLPMDAINHLVIYTDQYRYWIIEGLLDLADEKEWKISLQLIEEITDEEGMEIRQGLGFLSEYTLLVAAFSERNPIIDELNTIFPLLQTPHAFKGYSIILHQSLPDQYFPIHLQVDLFNARELEEGYRTTFQDEVVVIGEGDTYLEASVEEHGSFAFTGGRHIILPATEMVVELDPYSIGGTIQVNYSIGAYVEHNELVDPFGLVSEPVTLLIEEGKIVDIQGHDTIKRRLLDIVDLPYRTSSILLSIGLGPDQPVTGFVDHDRLLNQVGTLSWIDKRKNSYLEFVIGPVSVEQE